MIRLKSLLREEEIVKNKKTGNVYVVQSMDPNKHDKPTPAEIEKAKAREVYKKTDKIIAVARSIPVDFDPLPLATTLKDSTTELMEQRFNKLLEEKRQEDLRNYK